MAEPINLSDYRQSGAGTEIGRSIKGPSDGGGGGMDGTEACLKRLEEDGKETRADLKSIMATLAEMKASMATKSELGDVKVAVAKLETRVEKLPTMARIAGLVGIVGTLVTIIAKWHELVAYFAR